MGKRAVSGIPVFQWHPGRNLRWLVLCDHASNRVPPELGDLGLGAHERGQHIAWDIGARDIARRLARHLNAPMIEHGVSRLVIDANRPAEHRSLIPDTSDGIVVPGNQGITVSERQRRLDLYHQPYHRRIDRHLQQMAAISMVPTLVSVHSFTPQLGSEREPRKWPVAVLWDKEPLLARHLIQAMARDGTPVGDNQPYDARELSGDTIDRHAVGRKLPHATFELRQDQLRTPAMRAHWARRLFAALTHATAQLRAHPDQTGSGQSSLLMTACERVLA